MEDLAFKTVFFLAVVIFCIFIIGVFLLIIKLMFLFFPEITILGIQMTPKGL